MVLSCLENVSKVQIRNYSAEQRHLEIVSPAVAHAAPRGAAIKERKTSNSYNTSPDQRGVGRPVREKEKRPRTPTPKWGIWIQMPNFPMNPHSKFVCLVGCFF